jgi:nucleoside 2-deoxyribosyltransferase
MIVYLAGPLFTLAELNFNAELAAALTARGYEVWLPQIHEKGSDPAVFKRDRTAIDRAQIVVANMDGSDPDSGTCWECGYAYARSIPVVIFRTDRRSTSKTGMNSYNLMMTQSADARLHPPFVGIADLAAQIDAAVGPAIACCAARISSAANGPSI